MDEQEKQEMRAYFEAGDEEIARREGEPDTLRKAQTACEEAGWHRLTAIEKLTARGWHRRAAEYFVEDAFDAKSRG